MGLAASQARLLTITARLTDNEFRSQTINNAKMRLAAQSAQASENYINALNNATLKFTNYDEFGDISNQALTFNALTAYSSYNTQYGLVNSAGQILVSEAEADMFKNSNGDLNKYLAAHGLKYSTTYFDKVGTIENESYPLPYNEIGKEDLETYYNSYSSYENSTEVENFEKYYSEYKIAIKDFNKAQSAILSEYFTTGNTDILTYTDNTYSLKAIADAGNIGTAVNAYNKAFRNPSTNRFNIDKLVEYEYITEAERVYLLNSVGSYNYNESTEGVDFTESLSPDKPLSADKDGYKYYDVGEGFSLQVGSDGIVKDIINNELKTLAECNYLGLGEKTLSEFLKSFNYTTEDGQKYTFEYKDEGTDGSIYRSTTISNLDKIKKLLQANVDRTIKMMINYVNFEEFTKDMFNDVNADGKHTYFGINTKTTIKGLNKTIEEVLSNYTEAKDKFLGFIFDSSDSSETKKSSKDRVSENISLGNIDADDLKDIDDILKYAKDHELKFNSSFDTVIKEYIIDMVIEEFGTPKYAWIDEKDTTNTGNAEAKAQWYTNLFERMKKGYKTLENGLASSKEWIEYALESGIVYMEQVDKSQRWNSLDYKTCTRITEETDDAAVAKAEAEYNRAMNDIKAKDNLYDLQLKNIDTEHTSLQTEYDVIKSVINKNIERNFKFNQSA